MARKSSRRRRRTRLQQDYRRRKTRTKLETRKLARTSLLGFRRRLEVPYKTKKIPRNNQFSRKRNFLVRQRRWRDMQREDRKRLSKRLQRRDLLSPIDNNKKQRICKSRAVRREIMFATKKSGRGGQKKPVWRNKEVRCKRS
jgi:hypothetical protein